MQNVITEIEGVPNPVAGPFMLEKRLSQGFRSKTCLYYKKGNIR